MTGTFEDLFINGGGGEMSLMRRKVSYLYTRATELLFFYFRLNLTEQKRFKKKQLQYGKRKKGRIRRSMKRSK